MAEATVETNLALNKFYCHECQSRISPKLPEYTCPTCSGGFIEEIESEPNSSRNVEQSDPATQFSELWGRQFLESFTNPTPGRNADNSGNSSSSMEDDEDIHIPNFNPFTPPLFGHTHNLTGRGGGANTHVSIRRLGDSGSQVQIEGGNIHNVLEQLIVGLTGRGAGAILLGGPSGLTFGNLAGNPGDYVWGEGGLDGIITQLMNQLEGSGPPPASKDNIENLPTITIENKHIEKNSQCSVCFDDLKLDEKVKQLPCQHLYHKECIVPWLEQHGTCPVCRKTLDGTDTTCDENVQSIPDTLQTMGLNPQSNSSSGSGGNNTSSSRTAAVPNTTTSNTTPSTSLNNVNPSAGNSTQETTDSRDQVSRTYDDFDME